MNRRRYYVAIDLKSFYASVECVARELDPMTTNLVVADAARTEKTICLAVSPSLKSYGIGGRSRLFEVVERVREINAQRRLKAPRGQLIGESSHDPDVRQDPALALGYITATPRMALYLEYSTRIYDIYLRYIAPEDIHVYSIDEVFMDVTDYLQTYGCTARELAVRMIHDVLAETGITATAGIGANLYLCKVAMDIVAKHATADENGVRMAELDEDAYRRELWAHRPLTDFWRIGRGYARRLEENGLYTMGDVARCSVGRPNEYHNEELLYKLFGVNAELLIDHAWGWEPCTMQDVKAYRPTTSSVSTGQVLHCPYTAEKTRLIVQEMADALSMDLVDKGIVTDQLVLSVGYDIGNLADPERRKAYKGPVVTDFYGRQTPKAAHGTANLGEHTSSTRAIIAATLSLYDEIMDMHLLARRITLCANHLVTEENAAPRKAFEQLDLFTDYAAEAEKQARAEAERARERSIQHALLNVRKRYGKNALVKGMNMLEGATAMDRNHQIGGHRA